MIAQLGKAGFDEAMLAALTGEDVLAADETPVNVLDRTAPPAPRQEKRRKQGKRRRTRRRRKARPRPARRTC